MKEERKEENFNEFAFVFAASDEDKIVKAKEPAADSSLVCKYGEQELHLGDQVTDRNNCLDCTCLTPPLVECHQRENCERIFN